MKYREQQDEAIIIKTREILKELPPFVKDFFRGIAEITQARTRLAYAYDLKLFFDYLTQDGGRLDDFEANELTIKELKKVTATDINDFLDYLSLFVKGEVKHTNKEKGKSRKLAAVRRMFSYFYKAQLLDANPAERVDTPKIHEKEIIMLEPNEVARLLDEIESGEGLSEGQKKYHSFTCKRDLAIVTLLLGTGMRVSECVGIDISDIDFEVNGIRIIRKGGDEVVLYFGAEVEKALNDYLDEREEINPVAGSEDALFLSIQKKRINVRSIQNLVKKYSSHVTTMKKISPHKLRSTFGTNLYRESGDIYLVADVLGHKDVNTTRRHYAKMSDSNRRRAAKMVVLRDENEE